MGTLQQVFDQNMKEMFSPQKLGTVGMVEWGRTKQANRLISRYKG